MVHIVFEVPSGHQVKIVILTEFRGEGTDYVGGYVLGVVVVVAVVGIDLLDVVGHSSGRHAVGHGRHVAVEPPAGGLEGELASHVEHVLEGFDCDSRGGGDGETVVFLRRVAVVEGGISAGRRGHRVGAVLVEYGNAGDTHHCNLSQLAAHVAVVLGEDGLGVVHLVHRSVVVD